MGKWEAVVLFFKLCNLFLHPKILRSKLNLFEVLIICVCDLVYGPQRGRHEKHTPPTQTRRDEKIIQPDFLPCSIPFNEVKASADRETPFQSDFSRTGVGNIGRGVENMLTL